MLRNVLCIGHQHSLWLVALAAAVCIVATSTALHMLITGASRGGDKANPWVLFAGVVGGCGAWATHFIGMLAFDPGLVTGYDPEGTAFSLFIVIVFGVFSTLAAARLTAPWRMPAWSALFTVGVGAMHYTGMLAFRLPATLSWHPAFVVASLADGRLRCCRRGLKTTAASCSRPCASPRPSAGFTSSAWPESSSAPTPAYRFPTIVCREPTWPCWSAA